MRGRQGLRKVPFGPGLRKDSARAGQRPSKGVQDRGEASGQSTS